MRYQEWWISELPKQFEPHFDEVAVIVGKNNPNLQAQGGDFSPVKEAIRWECDQIDAYMEMKLYDDDDVLFIADLSFPGLFPNILHHKRPKKTFMFCHGTSINNLDYFENTSRCKFAIESSHSKMCDKVFIGSWYHQQKLGWANAVVTYLPHPPIQPSTNTGKTLDIVSASRLTPQKVNNRLETLVKDTFDIGVWRNISKSWEEYFDFLAHGKVLLITAAEETFGYQVVDAIMNGCVPVAPKRFSYLELLPPEYLYSSDQELCEIIQKVLDGKLSVPELKCETQMYEFYNRIVGAMKG